MTRGAFALLALLDASCTATLDLDRYHKDETPERTSASINVNYFDVNFVARSMQSHLNERLEVRVVDRLNAVQAKAVYDTVIGPDFSLFLGRIVPKANAPYRLDFWADHNNSRKYDGIVGGINDKDHAWRRVLGSPLPEDMRLDGSTYTLDFLHDTNFVDIFTDLDGNTISGVDTLLPCEMNVVLRPELAGKTMELRVVEKGGGRLVAFYRQGRAKASFQALITGVLDEETGYEVSAYVDVNESGKYDAGDAAFKLDMTSGSDGGRIDIDTTTLPEAPIETGEP